MTFSVHGRAFARIAAFHPELTAFRRDLHAHPELGFEEVYTAARVKQALELCGVDEIHTGIGKTGVVAVIHGRTRGSGRMMGLRADSTPQRSRRSAPTPALRANVQLVLDALEMAPAYVRNSRLDVLGSNASARALFSHVFDGATTVPNLARAQFLDARSDSFFIEREKMANDCVAVLRAEAGRNPFDKGLTDLVGELCTRSDDFRQRWARHDVRQHRTGIKRFRHPVVGELELGYEVLELAGEPDLHMLVYTAAVGTPAYDSLRLLASLAATPANIEA